MAKRTAEWLDDLNVRTVVDIGSGAGKLCVAAALACHCHFTGLERRPRLVAEARTLARLFDVHDRVNFIEGAFGDIVTPVADAYYLYNPFGEYLFGSGEYFDRDGKRDNKRRARDVAAVENLLQRAPIGTCVVTYNGFGDGYPQPINRSVSTMKCPTRSVCGGRSAALVLRLNPRQRSASPSLNSERSQPCV